MTGAYAYGVQAARSLSWQKPVAHIVYARRSQSRPVQMGLLTRIVGGSICTSQTAVLEIERSHVASHGAAFREYCGA
jgi:hypothetical protein